MGRFVEGADRGQATLLPECLDDWITALSHRVIQEVFAAINARDRAGVDDRCPGPHVLCSLAGHVEIAVKIGLQSYIEVLRRELFQRLSVVLEGGIVDQYVEATERLDHLLNDIPAVLKSADVAGQEQTAPALLIDGGLCDLRIRVFDEERDRNVGALARKQNGDRSANS